MKYKLKLVCVAWFSVCEETDFFIPAPESVVMIVSFTEKSWDTLQNVKNHDLLMELVVVVQKIYGMDGWMKVLCFMSLFREQSGTVD